MTIDQLAKAFVAGKNKGQMHNAQIDGNTYRLHGSAIAKISQDGKTLACNWCGYYSKTTASHLNAIINAFQRDNGLKMSTSVSYAKARNTSQTEFTLTA